MKVKSSLRSCTQSIKKAMISLFVGIGRFIMKSKDKMREMWSSMTGKQVCELVISLGIFFWVIGLVFLMLPVVAWSLSIASTSLFWLGKSIIFRGVVFVACLLIGAVILTGGIVALINWKKREQELRREIEMNSNPVIAVPEMRKEVPGLSKPPSGSVEGVSANYLVDVPLEDRTA